MNRKALVIILAISILIVLVSACGPSKEELAATATQEMINQGRTLTADAFRVAESLTAAAPTHTSTATNTPEPTSTFTPEPTATETPITTGQLSGKVYWLEGGDSMAAYLYMKSTEGGEMYEYSVMTNGNFSFPDVEPGTYMFEFQVALDNPVFGPCSGMSFNNSAEGISYSASIINGEIKLIIGRSESFSIAAGDQLTRDIPFSFTCQ